MKLISVPDRIIGMDDVTGMWYVGWYQGHYHSRDIEEGLTYDEAIALYNSEKYPMNEAELRRIIDESK